MVDLSDFPTLATPGSRVVNVRCPHCKVNTPNDAMLDFRSMPQAGYAMLCIHSYWILVENRDIDHSALFLLFRGES